MFAETIIAGAREMGVQMSPEQARMFETYHEMLIQANAQFNLTRVADDMREAIDRNYLDCIAPIAHGFSPETAIDEWGDMNQENQMKYGLVQMEIAKITMEDLDNPQNEPTGD